MDDRHTPVRAPRLVRRALAIVALALPAAFAPPASMATTVSMGYGHGCSVADTTLATCWGSLALPDLGPSTVSDVKVGRDFSCARLGGVVKCWGNNDVSQLGESANNPEGQWARGPQQAQQIAVGPRHACALSYGAIYCWGDASQGQMGEPARASVPVASQVQGLKRVVHIAAGNGATCVVQEDRSVACVGAGSGLADAAEAPRTPRTVPGIGDALEVSIFDGHACVLRVGGKVSCWGNNRYGELGVPASSGPLTSPVEVPGLGAAAKAVAVGNGYTCALLEGGTVKCWGTHANGQLGTGLAPSTATPATGLVIGITDATAISAGQTAACAALEGGYVQCWGEGAGWSSYPCRVPGGPYPGHADSFIDLPVCRAPGSAAPMAVKGLGPANDAVQVLEWAERTLPQIFAAQAADMPGHIDSYYLRTYPGGHQLAVNGNGTPHLMYLGPITGGQLADLGPLRQWLRKAAEHEGMVSGMQLQAAPYVKLIGYNGVCDGFTVPYAIRGGLHGLPADAVTTSVRVEGGGKSMEFPILSRFQMTVLTTETDWISQRTRRQGEPIPSGMKEEPVLFGRAQGCPSFGQVYEDVDVIVFYTQGNRKGQLRTRAKIDSVI
jgi:alpha-tubulin suppressor-like RCC1 family protein